MDWLCAVLLLLLLCLTNSGAASDMFLYVSFHDEPNIYTYNLEGLLISDAALNLNDAGPNQMRRGFTYPEHGMLVMNSYKLDSYITNFTCAKGSMESMGRFDVETDHSGLIHPYAIVRFEDHVFVSAQDTETVLRFDLQTGEPMDFGTSTVPPFDIASPFKGAIAYFNYQGGGGNGVRGLAVAKTENVSVLFVAFQGNYELGYPSAVYAIHATSGRLLEQITAGEGATGLHWNEEACQLYVGTTLGGVAAVQQFSLSNFRSTAPHFTWQLLHTFTHPTNGDYSLTHAAGLWVHEDLLWVANQDKGGGKNVILKFNITTGEYVYHLEVHEDEDEDEDGSRRLGSRRRRRRRRKDSRRRRRKDSRRRRKCCELPDTPEFIMIAPACESIVPLELATLSGKLAAQEVMATPAAVIVSLGMALAMCFTGRRCVSQRKPRLQMEMQTLTEKEDTPLMIS